MLREIDNRVTVRSRAVIQPQRAITGQRVDRRDGEIPWEALLAIPAEIGQRQTRTLRRQLATLDIPEHLIEANLAAVQRIRTVVRWQRVSHTIEREPASSNPIAIAADQGSKIRALLEISREGVVAKYNIGIVTVTVGRGERGHHPSVGHDVCLHPAARAQDIEIDR